MPRIYIPASLVKSVLGSLEQLVTNMLGKQNKWMLVLIFLNLSGLCVFWEEHLALKICSKDRSLPYALKKESRKRLFFISISVTLYISWLCVFAISKGATTA